MKTKHSNLNTFEDFRQFITENQIRNRKDFTTRFSGIYTRFRSLIDKSDVDKLLPKDNLRKNRSKVLSYSDFENFIKENNITSRTIFRNYKTIYSKFCKLSEEEKNNLLDNNSSKLKYIDLETFDDFQKFIKDNGITSRTHFQNKFQKAYNKFRVILTEKEKKRLLPSKRDPGEYKVPDSIEEFKVFIFENNIETRADLEKFGRAYKKFKKLSEKDKDELIPISDKSRSRGERIIFNILRDIKVAFIEEKTYVDLKSENEGLLRYDFFIPELNTIIEYHGSQHFNPNEKWYSTNYINRDKLKYEYAKNRGIKILYYTDYVKDYKKYGYFAPVITDLDTLINEIKKISPTN